ncbi:hypothetical protein ACFJIX_20985 [Roseateles sp. UC29_93]|uniref:hypothetical protein n=1 Tax=Roseateles sp. UC29_93 TaxID=3350177 RepID=UPI00366ED74B
MLATCVPWDAAACWVCGSSSTAGAPTFGAAAMASFMCLLSMTRPYGLGAVPSGSAP